jgi:hypothetical protein
MSDMIQFQGSLRPTYLKVEGKEYRGQEIIISCARHITVTGVPGHHKPFNMYEQKTKIEMTTDGILAQTQGLKMIVDSSSGDAYSYLKQRLASKDNHKSEVKSHSSQSLRTNQNPNSTEKNYGDMNSSHASSSRYVEQNSNVIFAERVPAAVSDKV